MTALLLGGAWAVLALAVVAPHRPPPPRVRALGRPADRPGQVALPFDPFAAVGGAVLRVPHRGGTRRSPPPSRAAARTVGATCLAVVGAVAIAPPLAPLALLLGWALPRWRTRTDEQRRLRRLESGLPEAVDLLVLAVGAGCNVPLALAAAGRRGTGPVAAELRRVSAEVARGRRLADALDDMPRRAGEPLRALAGVLAASERYGTPVLPALHRLAGEVRLQRQRRAEVAARKVPVALLFPLVVCVLPAFALLTVAPLVAGALRELRL